MRRFGSIAEFKEFLRAELPGRIKDAKLTGLNAAADLVMNEMKGEIGEYQSGDSEFPDMAPLSQATLYGFGPAPEKIGKIPQGYAPPDNPLLREGGMRDSIGKNVSEQGASVGTNDPVAIWQNDGTASRGEPYEKGVSVTPGIPGREFVGRAGFRMAPAAAAAISEALRKKMIGPDE